jgi:hypothetical protein
MPAAYPLDLVIIKPENEKKLSEFCDVVFVDFSASALLR